MRTHNSTVSGGDTLDKSENGEPFRMYVNDCIEQMVKFLQKSWIIELRINSSETEVP